MAGIETNSEREVVKTKKKKNRADVKLEGEESSPAELVG
jgi:hypothetical protein